MRKALISFLCIFILTACTKFEITDEIKPKIYIVGDSVGIEYELGDIIVADELKNLSPKMFQYFKENKDNITMRLQISYNAETTTTCYFKYYIGGIKIATNKNVVSSDLLIAKRDLINGFVLLSGKTASKKIPEKEIPPKIKNIQKESKPIRQSGDQKL